MSRIKTVYDPQTLRIMAAAYEHACSRMPDQFKDSDRVRRKLALHIIRELDDGESDPSSLADSAVLSTARYLTRALPSFR